MKNKEQNFCAKCGSLLIEIDRIVRPSGNPLYPITQIKYRCTDDSCQADTDKRIADALQQRLEREERSRNSKNKQSLLLRTKFAKVS